MPMFVFRLFTLFTVMTFQLLSCKQHPQAGNPVHFRWENCAPIPDSTGFAGSFAGTCNGNLLVAGGANFPDGGTPWNGAKKTWYDHIYLFNENKQAWTLAAHLPQPAGYGVSISTTSGILLIGGSNSSGHLSEVYKICNIGNDVSIETYPSLPMPLANTCGALVGNQVFIAGGLEWPDSSSTSSIFLSLDLDNLSAGWQTETTWPGPSRMLAVSGTDGNSFYLFSGTELVNGQRVYLDDAYRFTPGEGWTVLPALPHAVVAAPSPAAYLPQQGFFIFGGDDGVLAPRAAELKDAHPGFSTKILHYNLENERWTQPGAVKNPAPVTTSMVEWKGGYLLPGGEVRPGVRTNQVLMAIPSEK